ncbi:MAG: M1 family peptidase [Rhodocyclaceae bacterium]|nr:M1 family peptidase [Rhodocyclaceae bacterium]
MRATDTLIRLLAGLIFGLLAAASIAAEPVMLDMQLRLIPAKRMLEGSANLKLPAIANRRIAIDRRARLATLTVDGQPVRLRRWWRGDLEIRAIPDGASSVEMSWQLPLSPVPEEASHRDTLGDDRATAGSDGSFLPASARWYPGLQVGQDDGLQRWRVTIDVPAGQRAIVPGRLVEEAEASGYTRTVYRMDVPAAGIDLMVGPYVVLERAIKSVDGRTLKLRTLFHPRIADLAEGYLDALGAYFQRYEQWIGPYPYDDFSVVSSPTPTGFGMPSLTYLGVDVLRLPFIRGTSLGHEVLHNWWGNGVYPDIRQGNWSEGLTTFMADYTYALDEAPEKARVMRMGWLRDLSAIPPGKGLALNRFTARRHGISAAVGYGRAAMVFVMLRDRIGNAAFDRAIRRFWRQRRFQVASWADLQAAFEAEAGESLQAFLTPLLTARDLPTLALSHGDAGVMLHQSAPHHALRVPVVADPAAGKQTLMVGISGPEVRVEPPAGTRTLTLDPDFRVLRRLARNEAAPVLREINLAGVASLMVLGDERVEAAAEHLAERLLDRTPRRRSPEAPPGDGPLLVIGTATEVDAWLAAHGHPARPQAVSGRGDAQAWAGLTASDKPMLVVSGSNADALEAAARSLPHLGRYGWVVIEGGRSIDRGQGAAKPQVMSVPTAAPQAR